MLRFTTCYEFIFNFTKQAAIVRQVHLERIFHNPRLNYLPEFIYATGQSIFTSKTRRAFSRAHTAHHRPWPMTF